MLDAREWNTLQGALLYWQEEITSHDPRIAGPYLPDPNLEPLTSTEMERLRGKLETASLEFALYDPNSQQLAGWKLFPTAEAAGQHAAGNVRSVLALIPAAPSA